MSWEIRALHALPVPLRFQVSFPLWSPSLGSNSYNWQWRVWRMLGGMLLTPEFLPLEGLRRVIWTPSCSVPLVFPPTVHGRDCAGGTRGSKFLRHLWDMPYIPPDKWSYSKSKGRQLLTFHPAQLSPIAASPLPVPMSLPLRHWDWTWVMKATHEDRRKEMTRRRQEGWNWTGKRLKVKPECHLVFFPILLYSLNT